MRSLVAQLRDRRTLICLDNCEHVIDGAAELAGALLRSCPQVSVLTTSREPLAVPGELVWQVPPLAADEALRLFVERGRQVRQRFTAIPSIHGRSGRTGSHRRRLRKTRRNTSWATSSASCR